MTAKPTTELRECIRSGVLTGEAYRAATTFCQVYTVVTTEVTNHDNAIVSNADLLVSPLL